MKAIDVNVNTNMYKNFSKDLICCDDLMSDSFRLLTNSLPYTYKKFASELLSTERLKEVIEYCLIDFTQENYDNIRENHKSDLSLFVSKNIKNFLLSNSEYKVDIEDVRNLMFANIPGDHKIEIIKLYDELIICDNTLYANLLCNVIFKHSQSINWKCY